MHSAVRTYRIISSVSLLILRVLSHGQNICFYFANASARTSSDTASTYGDSKLLYYRTKVIECFIKLYYKMKENYTLNSNNLQNSPLLSIKSLKEPSSTITPSFIKRILSYFFKMVSFNLWVTTSAVKF